MQHKTATKNTKFSDGVTSNRKDNNNRHHSVNPYGGGQWLGNFPEGWKGEFGDAPMGDLYSCPPNSNCPSWANCCSGGICMVCVIGPEPGPEPIIVRKGGLMGKSTKRRR